MFFVPVRRWCHAGLAWLCFLAVGQAHPVSLSSAVVDVDERQVRVELQIMLEDLVLYHRLVADGELNYSAGDLKAAADKHQKFVLDYFSILDSHGNRLVGTVQNMSLDQIDADTIPQRELMQRFLALDIVYALTTEKPEYLTFVQNFGGEQSLLPAIMDIHVVSRDLFQESAQIVVNRPHTVRIDWMRESDGRRETLAELRKRRKEQFQARLGISSYSGLYSFLYITRFAIRHEILIPMLSLEQWLPIPRQAADFLEVEEQQAAMQAVRHFFEEHGVVTVNEQPVRGKVERVNFFGLDISDFALNAEPRRINVHQARVGVIVSYPSRTTPASVTFSWDQFTEYAPYIDSVLLIGDQKPDRFYFHPKSTRYEWSGSFDTPQVESVRHTLPLTNDRELQRVILALLTNVYRAFEFRDDGDVYDALASSIQGDLLRQVYLRVKRSLMMAEQGGEQSQAQQIEIITVQPNNSGEGTFEVTWRVSSTCEHWGHVHSRLTEYRAVLNLVSDNDLWKLDQFQLLDERRLQFETRIRGYDSDR